MDGQIHPQTASFLLLFPMAESGISDKCFLSNIIRELWEKHYKESALSFMGLSAKSPVFNHNQAEISGNDYACRLFCSFQKTRSRFD